MGAAGLVLVACLCGADASPGQIIGRVTDEAGEALEGARVTAQLPAANFLWHHMPITAKSGRNGRFTVDLPAAGVRYHLRASKAGRWVLPLVREGADGAMTMFYGRSDGVRWSVGVVGSAGGMARLNDIALKPDAARKELDIRIAAGEALWRRTGLVVDVEGRPLAGVRIGGPRGAIVTDAKGCAEMRGRPIGRHELEVTSEPILKNEYLRVPVTVVGGETIERTLRLGEGFRIAGRVMCGGKPVRNVHLWLSSEADPERKSFAHSDPDGSFQFINLPPRVTIRATPHESNLSVTKTFDQETDLTDATIDLPTGRIQGFVQDGKGRPWADATVRLTCLDLGDGAGARHTRQVLRCAAGRIDLPCLPDGRYPLDLMDDSRGYVGDAVLATREVTIKGGEMVRGIVLRESGPEKGVGSLLPAGPSGASHKRLPTPFSPGMRSPDFPATETR